MKPNPILIHILQAMQELEEIGGVKSTEEYLAVMATLRKEVGLRHANALCTINLDALSVEQIDGLIEAGLFTEQDVIHYYRNEQWRDKL